MSSELTTPIPTLTLSLEGMLTAYQYSQAIFALHRLRLPECLQQFGAQSLSQLAKAVGADAQALAYLLEFAVTLQLLHKDAQGCYAFTTNGQRLCPDGADSIIPFLAHCEDGYGVWSALPYTLQTGQPAFAQVYGQEIYQHLAQHPQKMDYFNRYMEQTTQRWLADVGKHYPFAGHLVDIGGNQGTLTALLLQQFPTLEATIFDLEQATVGIKDKFVAAGVNERCRIVTGSFFAPETIPATGDIYLISRVLLNWSDEQVVEILQNCRRMMPTQSKLLILDFALRDAPIAPALLQSLHLWVMFGARFRKRAEFEQLAQQAGFTQLRWIDIGGTLFLLEASPV